MPWYTYILFAIYIVSCFILIGVVLLQSGKGDIASAFGGGGGQSAFGPRGAASTLSKVTMGAAIAFMVLSFLFTVPGVLSSGSVAHGIEDVPANAPAQPAKPGQPAPAPAKAPAQAPAPATAPQPGAQGQPAATPAPQQKPAAAPAGNAKETPAKPEEKK